MAIEVAIYELWVLEDELACKQVYVPHCAVCTTRSWHTKNQCQRQNNFVCVCVIIFTTFFFNYLYNSWIDKLLVIIIRIYYSYYFFIYQMSIFFVKLFVCIDLLNRKSHMDLGPAFCPYLYVCLLFSTLGPNLGSELCYYFAWWEGSKDSNGAWLVWALGNNPEVCIRMDHIWTRVQYAPF